MSVQRVALDADGVLVDFHGRYKRILCHVGFADRANRRMKPDWDFAKTYGQDADDMVWNHFNTRPGLVINMCWLPGAQRALQDLRRDFEVVAVTSPAISSPYWSWERTQWLLAAGFTREQIVLTHGKHLIDADYLVDDRPENLTNFYGRRLLFHQPWNRLSQIGTRVRGWKATVQLIQRGKV